MPDPVNMVPLRARTVDRDMGLMVDTSRLPFVGSLRFLAGPTADSTLVVFAISLANRALNFRRDSNDLVAYYHVELTLKKDTGLVRQVVRDEKVRVSTVPETMRRDESIIFQQTLLIRPGIYTVSVVVRDRTSPAYAQYQVVDTVRSSTPRRWAGRCRLRGCRAGPARSIARAGSEPTRHDGVRRIGPSVCGGLWFRAGDTAGGARGRPG